MPRLPHSPDLPTTKPNTGRSAWPPPHHLPPLRVDLLLPPPQDAWEPKGPSSRSAGSFLPSSSTSEKHPEGGVGFRRLGSPGKRRAPRPPQVQYFEKGSWADPQHRETWAPGHPLRGVTRPTESSGIAWRREEGDSRGRQRWSDSSLRHTGRKPAGRRAHAH